MKNTINYLLKENKISLLKNYLISNKEKLQETNYKELLGIIELNLGNYDDARQIFITINKNSSKEYVAFIDEVVYKKYVPLYNNIIESISKNNPNKEEIKKFLEQAIKIYSNTDILELAVAYFITNGDKKSSLNYSKLGIVIDSTNSTFDKVLKNNKKKQNDIRIKVFGIISILIITFASYQVYSYKILYKESKVASINLSKSLIENKEIELKNTELIQILKEIEMKKSIFSTNEIYNLALKRYKNGRYNDAINLLISIKDKKLPKFKEKEIIFTIAMSYNKLKSYDKAKSYFKYFKENYNENRFNKYLKICTYNLDAIDRKTKN